MVTITPGPHPDEEAILDRIEDMLTLGFHVSSCVVTIERLLPDGRYAYLERWKVFVGRSVTEARQYILDGACGMDWGPV